MNFISVIILAYLAGAGLSWSLIDLVEDYKGQKFTTNERIKLMLGSWYTCIVLNNMLRHD